MYYGTQKDPSRYNGRCKRCGWKGSVLVVELRPSVMDGKNVDVAVDESGHPHEFRDGYCVVVRHACSLGQERLTKLTRVIGVYNPGRQCNAKCLAAIGHDCECRCGGKNHGAGFTL